MEMTRERTMRGTYRRRYRRGARFSGFAICAAMSVAFASGSLHALPSIDPRVSEQLEMADAARILVVLAPPPVGEAAALGVDSPTRFLTQILADDAFSVKQISSLPIAVAEVNRTGLKRLEENPLIAAVYADEPEDPFLHVSVPLMEADAAHGADIVGAGHSIAILDTGVNYEHPFLTGKLQAEACFSTSKSMVYNVRTLCPNGEDVDTTPGSGLHCTGNPAQCSHGTHVAGIALGGPGQGQEYQASGVAYEAGLIAIQVFTEFNDGWRCGGSDKTPCIKSFPSDQLTALEHVRTLADEFKIAAVNMSLGAQRREDACNNDPRSAVINELRDLGIATVIASGNDGFYNAVSEPACVPEAIAVGASRADDIGLNTEFSNTSDLVDFVAPGTNVKSSLPQGFGAMSGTSMAAPHVAGIFALLRSHVPHATVGQIQVALQATSKRTIDPRTNLELHFPDVNKAAETLQMLAGDAQRKDDLPTDFAMMKAGVVGLPRIIVVVDENGIVRDEMRYREAMTHLRDKFGVSQVARVAVNRFILEKHPGFDSADVVYLVQHLGQNTKLYGDSPNVTQ